MGGDRQTEVLSILLASTDEVNAVDVYGKSALMYACEYNFVPEQPLLLLKSGADPALKDAEGKTALTYARANETMISDPAWPELEAALMR